MDATREQKVKDTVNSFMAKGFMFTAYDVTKTLRNAGETVKHGDVNNIVQAMFKNSELGQYTREVVDVGAPVQPWVYYHPYSDVNNYDQHWVENNPDQDGMKNDGDGSGTTTAGGYVPASSLGGIGTPTAPAASATSPAAPTAPVAPKKGGLTVTQSENRLQISVKAVRVAGFTPHQNVFVYVSPSNTEIVIKDNMSCPNMKLQGNTFVNKDGRIRLCKTFLKKLSLPSVATAEFKVNAAAGEVTVLPL